MYFKEKDHSYFALYVGHFIDENMSNLCFIIKHMLLVVA